MAAARKRAAVAAHGEAVAEYRKVWGSSWGGRISLSAMFPATPRTAGSDHASLDGVRSDILRLTRERDWIDIGRSVWRKPGARRRRPPRNGAAEARQRLGRTRAMIAGAEIVDLDAKIASLDAEIAERDAPLTAPAKGSGTPAARRWPCSGNSRMS